MADVKSEKAVKAFAAAHGLEFHKRNAPQLPFASITHRLQSGHRELVVQGMWRGNFVQRFIADGFSVELLVLPYALPTLQLVPTLASYDHEPATGPMVPMPDAQFNEHWRVSSENAAFAYDFVTPPVRDALAHEAAYGKAVGIDGPMLFLFTPLAPVTADELRVRFEFLSVLASRIDAGVWQRWARGGMPAVAAPATQFASPMGMSPAAQLASLPAPSGPPASGGIPMSTVPIVPPSVPGAPPMAPSPVGVAFVPDSGLSITGGFLPTGDDVPENQGWIGGDDQDQSRLYLTGPRLKGQAKPRV